MLVCTVDFFFYDASVKTLKWLVAWNVELITEEEEGQSERGREQQESRPEKKWEKHVV